MDGPLPPREGPSFLTFEERGELYGLPVCASAGDDNSPRPRERKRESSRGSSFLGGLPRFRLNTAPAQQLISHGDYYQRGWFASLAAQPEPDDMASFYPLGHLSSDGDSLSELLRDDQRVICWLCAAQAACAGGYLLLQWGEEILGDAWQREAVFFFTAAACLASSLVGLAGARWRSRQLLNWYLMSQFFAASSVLQQAIRDASESEGHRVWCSEDDVDVQHNEDGAVPRRATPRRAAPRRAAHTHPLPGVAPAHRRCAPSVRPPQPRASESRDARRRGLWVSRLRRAAAAARLLQCRVRIHLLCQRDGGGAAGEDRAEQHRADRPLRLAHAAQLGAGARPLRATCPRGLRRRAGLAVAVDLCARAADISAVERAPLSAQPLE